MSEETLRQRVLLLCLGMPRIAAPVLAWVQEAPEGPARDRRMAALESCAARSLRTDGSAACLIEAAIAAEKFIVGDAGPKKPARGASPGPATARALHGHNPIRETQP